MLSIVVPHRALRKTGQHGVMQTFPNPDELSSVLPAECGFDAASVKRNGNAGSSLCAFAVGAQVGLLFCGLLQPLGKHRQKDNPSG
jgi:hypothetical protein